MRLMIICCLSCLMGCSPHSIHLNLKAGPRVNLDPQHRSLPVLVRIYQLNNPKTFRTATFASLWKQDARTLGSSLIAHEELLLLPGQSQSLIMSHQPNATHIAAIALFRDPAHAVWQDLKPLKRRWFKQHLTITVNNKSLRLES